MLEVVVPGEGVIKLEHVVLDFNGTIACDGKLVPGVEEKINKLAESLHIHILTADTFGTCRHMCRNLNCSTHVLTAATGSAEKKKFVESLGAARVAAVGNGANDTLMLSRAALGIAVVGPEGASSKALQASDIVVNSIDAALDLLLNPKRITATLRL